MNPHRTALTWLFWLAPVVTGGCNAIFGIEPAASGSASSSGSGGATSTAETSSGSGGTGGAPACPPDRIQPCEPAGGACASHLLDGTLNNAIRLALSGDFLFISTDIGIHRERYDGTQGLDFGAVASGTDGFTVAGDHVYWANYFNGVVSGAKIDGTSPTIIAKLPAADTIGSSRVAARGGFVYWTSYTPHAIWRAKDDGSQQQTPLTVVSENDPMLKVVAPFSVAVDDTYLYWTDQKDGVRRMPVADIGTASAKILDFAIDATAPPTEMVLDQARVYWISPFGQVSSKAKSADPAEAPLVYQGAQPDVPVQLTVDETHVYWIARSGAVSRARKTEGTVEPVVAASLPAPPDPPKGLAVDCGAIYWNMADPAPATKGSLYKAAKGP